MEDEVNDVSATDPRSRERAEKASPQLLRPAIFEDLTGYVAAFSTRKGGVSEGPYTTLNLGLSTGDEGEHVWANRWAFTEALDFTPEQLALAGQVHGDDILEIDEAGLFRGYDGLVTDRAGLLLGITAADCAAVLLADPEARVIGVCHSGWRGTAARISAKTVHVMRRRGARPERLRAYVSPCISVEHFEVGPEVAAQFEAAYVTQPDGAKPHVDLKTAIRDQLQEAGVPARQIEVSPHCTAAETDIFYSYRAEDGTTGRMMGVVGMKRA